MFISVEMSHYFCWVERQINAPDWKSEDNRLYLATVLARRISIILIYVLDFRYARIDENYFGIIIDTV